MAANPPYGSAWSVYCSPTFVPLLPQVPQYDWLEEDLFSDNCYYTVRGVTHHWNGIENYQTKGVMTNLDNRRQGFKTDYVNIANREYRSSVYVVAPSRDVLIDEIADIDPTRWGRKLRTHQYYGWMMRPDVRLFGGGMWSDFCLFHAYATFDQCYVDGSWRYADAYNNPTSRPQTINLHYYARFILRLDEDRTQLLEIPYSIGNRAFAAEWPEKLSTRWVLDTAYENFKEYFYSHSPTVSGWRDMKLTLAQTIRLDFHEPDYRAIFDNRLRLGFNWNALASEAYQGLNYSDINGIAYVHDLLEMGGAVTSFLKTVRSLPDKRAKAMAQMYLSVHFGFKLFFADTLELRDYLEKASLRNSRMSKCSAFQEFAVANVSYTAGYQVFYNEFAQLTSMLDELLLLSDAYLTFENMWDMVPWSFVIDWFTNIGDVLSAVDGFLNVSRRHEVLAVGRSIKGSSSVLPSQLGLPLGADTSGLEFTYYLRRYTKSLVTPTLLPKLSLSTDFNHLIEAAALVISSGK